MKFLSISAIVALIALSTGCATQSIMQRQDALEDKVNDTRYHFQQLDKFVRDTLAQQSVFERGF